MQAEESPRAVTSERSGLKPTTAFLLLLLGAALVAVVFYLSKPDPAPTPTGDKTNTAPNFALTNEQAITRLEDLDRLRQQAYRSVDPSLLPSIYLSNSPVLRLATEDLRKLSSDGVSDMSVYTTRSVAVQSNTTDEIVIVQEVDVEPHFIGPSGKELTSGAELIRRRIEWTLQRAGSIWLVADSVIKKASVIRG